MTDWQVWLEIIEARKLVADYEEALINALRRKVEGEIIEAFFGPLITSQQKDA